MEWLLGVALGAAYVLPPGPVLVETVRRGLRGGTPASVAVQLGAVLGDLSYAALIRGGLGDMLHHETLQFWLGLLGATLLMSLGVITLRERRRARKGFAAEPVHGAEQQRLLHHLGTGLALAIFNPYAVAFWFTVGGTTLHSHCALAGFAVGSLLASLLMALLAGQLRRPRWQQATDWVYGGCGLALVFLGIQLGVSTLVM
ncbi:MAG: LysE family transporter [Chloroflexaceae bacterium]|jgi:chemosensory pili system protein ChpE|nr:LysE family transporter [Chloroflexaceae bacterium]